MYKELLPITPILNKAVFFFTALFFAQNGLGADLQPPLSEQAILDRYAREFHERLTRYDPVWFANGVQAYYKKLAPVTSQPDPGVNQWTSTVKIGGQSLLPQPNGTYKTQDGSLQLKIDPNTDFEKSKEFTVLLTGKGVSVPVTVNKKSEERALALSRFDSYQELINNTLKKGAWWSPKRVFAGTIEIPDQEDVEIVMECAGSKKYSIALHGIGISYRKEEAKTRIYLDLRDFFGNPVEYSRSIECDHKKTELTNKVFFIKQQLLHECDAKDVTFELFDSAEKRSKWVPNNSFYDLLRRLVTNLPMQYSNYANKHESVVKPLIWILSGQRNGCYELGANKTLAGKSDYMYSQGDGTFCVTLPYQTTIKEYLSESPEVPVHCVTCFPTPTVSFHKDVAIEGGHRSWPKGLYQKQNIENNKTLWQKVDAMQANANISFVQYPNETADQYGIKNNFNVNPPYFTGDLDIEKTKEQWCDAAQRCFENFFAKISHCDPSVANKFPAWSNLTNLDISRLAVRIDIDWRDILAKIGTMKQLVKLDLSGNSPNSHFNEDYTQLADQASDFYIAMGNCIGQLKKLRELHLHDLWLKPPNWLSNPLREVAILTGVINHKNRIGIETVLNNINSLEKLNTLSMDGIPESGLSFFFRQNNTTRYTLSFFPYLSLITAPCSAIDQRRQSNGLKNLALTAASILANKSSLKTLSLYTLPIKTPEFFIKFLVENIITSRPRQLPRLEINFNPLTQ